MVNPLVFLILASIAVLSVFIDLHSHFWTEHAFVTGIATGFFALATTVLILDRILQSRDKKKWFFVAAVGYRALGRETRDVTTTTAALYCDLDQPFEADASQPNFLTDALTPLGDIRYIPADKVTLKVFTEANLPPLSDIEVGLLLPLLRLKRLIIDKEWVNLAEREYAKLVERNKITVGQWAPLLMNSSSSREMLNFFSSLNDDIWALSHEFARLKIDGNALHREKILQTMQIVDLKARLITNELWNLSGYSQYSFVIPKTYSHISLSQAFNDVNLLNRTFPIQKIGSEN